MGLMSLSEEEEPSLPPLSPSPWLPVHPCHVGRWEKAATYQPGREPAPELWLYSADPHPEGQGVETQ